MWVYETSSLPATAVHPSNNLVMWTCYCYVCKANLMFEAAVSYVRPVPFPACDTLVLSSFNDNKECHRNRQPNERSRGEDVLWSQGVMPYPYTLPKWAV
jgi:hypothetical protein